MDINFIMDYESGKLNKDEIIAGFQKGIDSGQVWKLQGSYGRTAHALISAGYCTPPLDPGVRRNIIGQQAAARAYCRGDSCGD